MHERNGLESHGWVCDWWQQIKPNNIHCYYVVATGKKRRQGTKQSTAVVVVEPEEYCVDLRA